MSADVSPAPSVLAAIRQAFVVHAPFSEMRDADLDAIARATTVRYFSAGEIILPASAEPPREALFIRQGNVRGEPLAAPHGHDPAVSTWDGTAGEMFPLGELVAKRGTSLAYRALRDTFVLAFPATLFDALLDRSAVFADFCTQTLRHLLGLARAAMQAEYAAAMTDRHGSATPLATLLRAPAITVGPDAAIGEALQLMESRRIGTLPIVDDAHRPLGIFTRQDVVGRVVMPRIPLHTPIGDLMSAPVVTLPVTATADEAAFEMTSRGIRHVVVIDDSGAVTGVVSERDLFSLQRLSLREIASDIRRARDLGALRRSSTDVRALAYALVAQGVASGQLTRMISSLNDQVLQRVLQLISPAHALADIRLCWIGMGSEGRSEQTIATDQDNGLIFVAEDAQADATRDRLLPFAREVNQALDHLGYPLCKGGVMAMNPRWCASLREWQRSFQRWIELGDPRSLLASNIFFDFRPLWGDATLAHELRGDVAIRARANSRFAKQMADNALRNRPALNWFGELQGEGDDDAIDLKLRAASPIVDGARIYALASGVTTTNTVDRLVAAGPLRGIPAVEIRGWCDAFEFLQMMRLRTQHRMETGLLPRADNPNRVPLGDLSPLDRRMLREALRQVRTLQQRLQLDYPG